MSVCTHPLPQASSHCKTPYPYAFHKAISFQLPCIIALNFSFKHSVFALQELAPPLFSQYTHPQPLTQPIVVYQLLSSSQPTIKPPPLDSAPPKQNPPHFSSAQRTDFSLKGLTGWALWYLLPHLLSNNHENSWLAVFSVFWNAPKAPGKHSS